MIVAGLRAGFDPLQTLRIEGENAMTKKERRQAEALAWGITLTLYPLIIFKALFLI